MFVALFTFFIVIFKQNYSLLKTVTLMLIGLII